MCDFISRLFSIHEQLCNDPTFHINYTFPSESSLALPPTPATPITPAPKNSAFHPTSPTSPYVPPSSITFSTPKKIQLLFSPATPVTPTQLTFTPSAPSLPSSTSEEPTGDSSTNFETKIKPQFYAFVVWLVARLRGPAKLFVEKRISEIFARNE